MSDKPNKPILTGAAKYGEYFWAVIIPGMQLRMMADRIEIKDGCLILHNHKSSGESYIGNVFAPGQWRSVMAISVFDGGAIAVDGTTLLRD